MNNMKVFENSEFGQLEVLWKDGKAYFPAIRCAEVLGYSNPRDAIQRHCKAEGVVKHDVVVQTTNQHGFTSNQTVCKKFIVEGNLYRLIIRSKLESAQRFERWVFDEVLPAIRKYGFYATDDMLEEFLNDPDLAIGVRFMAFTMVMNSSTLTPQTNMAASPHMSLNAVRTGQSRN